MYNKVIPFLLFSLLLLLSGCSNSIGIDDDHIPSTSIHLSLYASSHVHLWVENAYHTKVITILDEHLEAGGYSIPVEMKDEKGKRLPNGLYTYYVKTDHLSASRILILR